MNHSNMYAVGLALCTFANIASEEMSRDLANEIEKLLGSSNTYIRKKVSHLPAAYPMDPVNLIPIGCIVRFASGKEGSRHRRPFHPQSQEPANRSESRCATHCHYARHGDVPD